MKPPRSRSPKGVPSLSAAAVAAMRLRVSLSSIQARKAGMWIYAAHAFRNAAVAFLEERRRKRAGWVARHPALARDWIPQEFKGSDVNACSQWLTGKLEQTRKTLALEMGVPGSLGKKSLAEAVTHRWAWSSRGERDNLRAVLMEQGLDPLWVMLPRTVLDQTLQDLVKTTAKAIADRTENKRRKAMGLKPMKTAGFPRFQKFSFSHSIRFQVVATKNKDVREAWARKELFIPGLGRLKTRERGYAWPATPPKLVTVARSANGTWHASFVCGPGQARSARQRRLDRQGIAWEALPVDESTGLPAIEGLDMSLTEKAVSNVHGNLGRTRYLKRCDSALRFRSKALSRAQKGSRRYQRAQLALGRLHVRVANHRQHENRSAAQRVADRSAIVCVETLKLSFLQKNRRLAQSTADLGWGQFLKELEQAMAARGHLLLYAGQFDPTTQTCPACGTLNRALKNNLSTRAWQCQACGADHGRDDAAAHNIQDFAVERFLESFTGAESAPGNGPLHPELAAFVTRGGMTAFRRGNSRERRQEKLLGLEMPVKRESTPTTTALSGTVAVGEREEL